MKYKYASGGRLAVLVVGSWSLVLGPCSLPSRAIDIWPKGAGAQGEGWWEEGEASQEQKAAGSGQAGGAAATGKVCRANNVHFWRINIHRLLIYICIYICICVCICILADCSLEWQIKQSWLPLPPPAANEYVYASWHCNNFINMQATRLHLNSNCAAHKLGFKDNNAIMIPACQLNGKFTALEVPDSQLYATGVFGQIYI